MDTSRSQALFLRAQKHIPGGVNSPVRAFGSVGGTPRFIQKAQGVSVTDADGNSYTDYIGSWGPMLLGHNHPVIREAVIRAAQDGLSFGAATGRECQMAEKLCALVPSVEMVRLVNSGTEAVMSTLRAARGYTGRDKIIKFAGCYHGHCDAMLVQAGSGLMTAGIPSSAGITQGCAQDTLTAPYNDLNAVRQIWEQNPGQIAAVILEPVAANMGVVPPKPGFLAGLRELCTLHGTLLIFDEVITGFRLGLGGAQEYYGVKPDLTCFGKVIGAGMPVGAYGGRREVMEQIAPLGPVYQAGTLSGNPIAVAAGLAQLDILERDPSLYLTLEQRGRQLREGLRALLQTYSTPGAVQGEGSLSCLFFHPAPVSDYETAKQSDTARYARYFHYLLEHGIYLAPSQFEAIFLSAAHTPEHIDELLSRTEEFFRTL